MGEINTICSATEPRVVQLGGEKTLAVASPAGPTMDPFSLQLMSAV